MERIILSLSLILILVQNASAMSDAEWDDKIATEPSELNRLIFRCDKEVDNHKYNGNPEVCVQAFNTLRTYPLSIVKDTCSIMAQDAGFLFNYSKKNYVKAYEYYLKSAKLDNTVAQKNLDILCKQHSWVCK